MNEGNTHRSKGRRWQIFAGLVMMAFVVTLAVIIGNRLSDESLAVLAGAVCGVGAAIPTSLLIVAVARRRDEPRSQPTTTPGPYPPVVVVTPPGGQPWPGNQNALPPSLRAPVQRHFTVVGDAAEDMEI